MNREEQLAKLASNEFDVIVIGGGATGLGAALDSVSRGFSTLLLEQSDFAKGTSSRSTKLIHGGLRYLQQGDLSLVIEALRERGLLCQNAPHLIHHQPFLIPLYKFWDGPFYGAGLKVYDLLAGKLGLKPSQHLSRNQTIRAIPTLERENLRGGMLYYDGQFDDARLALTLAQTITDLGGCALNYFPVKRLLKKKGMVIGVEAENIETHKRYQFQAKVVINATGIFSDRFLNLPKEDKLITVSQGTHLVLPRHFLPGEEAILIPETEDKRVVFLVPWHDRIIVGTTDIPKKKAELEPKPMQKEIAFLLKYAKKYLNPNPSTSDILSVFAGLRPLVTEKKEGKTSKISRDHTILVSPSGLITIAGGKWTTFRKMGQDVIECAIPLANLPETPSKTENLPLHGCHRKLHPHSPLSTYGTDKKEILALKQKELIHPRLPYTKAEITWGIENEMAMTLEDLLSRRTRALLLDALATIEAAPKVVYWLAQKRGKSESWAKAELREFLNLAKHYLPKERQKEIPSFAVLWERYPKSSSTKISIRRKKQSKRAR